MMNSIVRLLKKKTIDKFLFSSSFSPEDEDKICQAVKS